jgi:hypothetical protein
MSLVLIEVVGVYGSSGVLWENKFGPTKSQESFLL